MFDVDELFSKRNQRFAFESLEVKPMSRGIDNMPISDLKEYWKVNGEGILNSIKNKTYRFGVIKLKEIINNKGKKREISVINSIDKLILRLLYQKLERYIGVDFLDNSFAYQKGKGIVDAVSKCKEYIESGYEYVLELDIEGFFDNIDLVKMENKLFEYIDDEIVKYLIHNSLYCQVSIDGRIVSKNKGLIQGSPTSSILSNLYLHEFDKYLDEKGYKWVRYADDINIYTKTIDEANIIYEESIGYLKDNLNLNINEKKSGVYEAIDRMYLGYEFKKYKNGIDVRKHEYKRNVINYNWNISSISRINNQYHLVDPGILNKKDFALLFENSDKKYNIPIEVVDQINVYSNVTIAYDVIKDLCDRKIRICYVDKYGNSLCYLTPAVNTKPANIMLKQANFYNDKARRLELAKSMEIAGLYNIISNVKYYNKKLNNLNAEVKELKDFVKVFNECKNIDELMLVEARVRQMYYQSFNKILNDKNFVFLKRSKQPPLDRINALISFGNTVLYNEIARIIGKTALDIKIGIIHATNRRSASLNLDFADLFKPILVDRIIFTLVNRKQVASIDFEETEDNGIYLTNNAKRLFVDNFEGKLQTKVNYKERKITYRKLLEVEIHKYLNYLDKGEKYKPYRYY